MSLSKNFKTTILITTHYIEEAKRADMIGFLRKGQLLVEQTPKSLMKKYETSSLEQIFFQLCLEQIESKKSKQKARHHFEVDFNNSVNELIEKSKLKSPPPKLDQPTPSTSSSSSSPDLNELKLNNDYKNEYNTNTTNSTSDEDLFKIPWIDHYDRSRISKWFIQFFAIIIKYFILTKRRPETVLAQYVLPIVAVAVFCVCIGSTPTGIKLAVINEEDCGFPYDMNQHFTEPIPENSIDEFIKKFENLFGTNNADKDGDEERIKLRKRSIDEVTTLNLDMFNDEEEVTTVYPSKFNLMNNLHFNEHKLGLTGDHESKSLNDLVSNSEDRNSIDKLIANNDLPTTESTVDNINNHKLTSKDQTGNSPSESSDEHLVSTTTPSIVAVSDHSPILMPVLSNDADSNEHTNPSDETNEHTNHGDETNESTNEKLPSKLDEEDDEDLDDVQVSSVNTQFEDACFSQDLIRKMHSFIFTKIPYDSFEKAIEDIRSGKIWGVIRIKKGFSRALISKILFQDYGGVNISNSLVEVNADLTNKALAVTLEVTLNRLYPELVKGVFAKANQINLKSNTINHTNYKFYNINSGRLPIVLGSHVFKAKFTLSDYFGIREFAGKFTCT